MISARDDDRRGERRALAFSVVASAILNIAIWIISVWAYGFHLALPLHADREPVFQVSSSSIRIEHRTVPQVAPVQPVRPAPARPVAPQPQTRPRPRPTEIARIVPRATPAPRIEKPKNAAAPSLSEQLAQQERLFAREAKALNASRAPLSAATADPNAHAAAEHPFTINIPGLQVARGPGNGILEPLQMWHDRGYSCYYGRYTWTYPGGGSESANIPWPFCYAPGRDPLALGLREIPFPLPPPGFRVAPGTQLDPIEKEIYERWLAAQR